MSKQNAISDSEATYRVNKKIRRDWGNISSAMKVFTDKRFKSPKHKHKNKIKEDYE